VPAADFWCTTDAAVLVSTQQRTAGPMVIARCLNLMHFIDQALIARRLIPKS